MIKFIRKFGLSYCDLPTMIWNVTFLLRFLALNLDRRYTKNTPFLIYLMNLIMASAFYYVYLISVVWFIFFESSESRDFGTTIIVFSLGLNTEIGITKLWFMFKNKSALRDIVDGYLACDSTVKVQSRFASNILKHMRVVKKRAAVFWCVVIGNGIAYILRPLLRPGRYLMEDEFIFLGLDPMLESPNYEIAMFINACAVMFVIYPPANITGFFIIVVGYTESQMIALSEEIKHAWADAVTYSKKTGLNNHTANTNDYLRTRLHDIAKFHRENINLVKQVENAFQGAIAVEFVILVVGLLADLLGGLESTYIQLPIVLMFVFMDCLVGQRLIDANSIFEAAVYDSKWENFNVSNRKVVLLMLLNSQKTMTLSAGSVSVLCFGCFMTVIRSTYSAYTALRSTMV